MNPATTISRLIFTAAMLAVIAGLSFLSHWQVQRHQWKTELIASAKARLAQDPLTIRTLGDIRALDLSAVNFQRASLFGVFEKEQDVLLYQHVSDQTSPLYGPGADVYTPFILLDGTRVMVNRGFVPQKNLEKNDYQIDGGAGGQIGGVLRAPESKNAFTPDDDFAKRMIFLRDPERMAAVLSLSAVAPFTLEIEPESAVKNQFPQPRPINIDLPNRHMGYAFTWGGLALVVAGMLVAYLLKTRKEK